MTSTPADQAEVDVWPPYRERAGCRVTPLIEAAAMFPAFKHGEYLQAKVLGRLLRRGGDRLGVFTLVEQ